MNAGGRVLGALLAFLGVAAVAVGLAFGAVWLFANPVGQSGSVLTVVEPTAETEAPTIRTVAPNAGCVSFTAPTSPEGDELPRGDAPASEVDYALPGCLSADDATAYVEYSFARDEEDIWAPQTEANLRTERFATCAWVLDWLNADSVDDQSRMDAAAAWLADPANQVAHAASGTNGAVNLLNRAANGAAEGDRSLVEEAKERTCDPDMGLHLAY